MWFVSSLESRMSLFGQFYASGKMLSVFACGQEWLQNYNWVRYSHYTLILLQQLVGELGQYLQEHEVGWGGPGVAAPFRTPPVLHSKLDAGPVQGRYGLPVLQSVQAKGQGKALCKFLGVVKKTFL